MPRFSVIIPCHNAEAYLGAALAALEAQTCGDWEAVCIDDGSTDRTPAILTAALRRDRRIRVVRQRNAGPAEARNHGARLARGEILAFLDADDLWAAEKLACLDRAFRTAPAPDAVFARTAFFQRDPAQPGAFSTVPEQPLRVRDLIGENPACTMSNIAVRAETFHRTSGFDARLSHSEDLEWLIRLVGTGARVVGLSQTLTFYRANESGLSADLAAMHRGWARASLAARMADPSLTPAELRAAEAVHLRYLARRALRTGAPPLTATALALRGTCLSPRGFFSNRRRGLAVLGGALAAPFLGAAGRRAAFAE